MHQKELLQTALRVLQRINRKLPVDPEDERVIRENTAPSHVGQSLDLVAVEIIQRLVRK